MRVDARLAVRFRAPAAGGLRCLLNGSQCWSLSSRPASPQPQPWSPGSDGSMTGSTPALQKQLGNAPRFVNAWHTLKGRSMCFVLTLHLAGATKAPPECRGRRSSRMVLGCEYAHEASGRDQALTEVAWAAGPEAPRGWLTHRPLRAPQRATIRDFDRLASPTTCSRTARRDGRRKPNSRRPCPPTPRPAAISGRLCVSTHTSHHPEVDREQR